MNSDPRDELWQVSFETYYDVYFQEMVADRLVGRWQRADEVTKLIVALTASGSAVSGWALWSEPHLKVLWAVFAGAAAAFSIGHSTLGVPARLKDLGELKRRFAGVRIDLETMRYAMRIDPEFPLDEFATKFGELRQKYADGFQLLKNDILETRRFDNAIQDELNRQLGDTIEVAP